jgi:hypothetical protein
MNADFADRLYQCVINLKKYRDVLVTRERIIGLLQEILLALTSNEGHANVPVEIIRRIQMEYGSEITEYIATIRRLIDTLASGRAISTKGFYSIR